KLALRPNKSSSSGSPRPCDNERPQDGRQTTDTRPECCYLSSVVCRPSSVRWCAIDRQNLADKVKRAGNQNARRRLQVESTSRRERALDILGSLRWDVDGARPFRDRVRSQGLVLARDANSDDAAGETGEILQEG